MYTVDLRQYMKQCELTQHMLEIFINGQRDDIWQQNVCTQEARVNAIVRLAKCKVK